MFDFTGRVAIVTGAAGNLGRAVAGALEAAGARLVLVDRAADRLPKLYEHLADAPDHYLATSVEATDPDVVAAMVAEAFDRFGQIDVLMNVVGAYSGGTPAHETALKDWDRMFDVNVRSALVVSRAVVPHMLDQGYGKIVNVGSRNALSGGKNAAAYSAAKGALLRLTESMAAELKAGGVNVNCVLPGTIDTPQNRAAMPNADYRRWVAPAAIADVMLFLASDAARAVHGVAIPVF